MAKQIIPSSYYVFTPGASGVGNINFSNFKGFNFGNLTSITNATRSTIIYGVPYTALGGTFSGSTLTLTFDTSTMLAGDVLEVVYDIPNQLTFTTTAYTSATGVLNTDMITGNVNGWFDVSSFKSISILIRTTTTVTAGGLSFETTNDNTVTSGVALPLQDSGTTNASIATTLTLVANTSRFFESQINYRYIRIRFSTAFAGTGNVLAVVMLSPSPYIGLASKNMNITNSPAVTVSSGTVGTQNILPTVVTDVSNGAITTTTTTAAITPAFGTGYVIQIPVTAVSGTNPRMLFVVQESYDSGTNWVDIYHFEAITATGVYVSPVLSLQGNRLRYVQTISGTTPSFTRSVSRMQNNLDYIYIRQIYDRTLAINTLNARSAVLFSPNTDNINVVVDMGAGGTAPVLQLQGSMDNTNWVNIGSTLTPTVGGVVNQVANNANFKFYSLLVTTAGVGASLDYICFVGYS